MIISERAIEVNRPYLFVPVRLGLDLASLICVHPWLFFLAMDIVDLSVA